MASSRTNPKSGSRGSSSSARGRSSGRASGRGGGGRGDGEAVVSTPGVRVLRAAGWLVLAGLWAFLLIALVSFHPADAPGHAVYPPNEPVSNWGGPVGAYASYHLLRLLGLSAWLLMLLAAVGLFVSAKRPRHGVAAVGMPILRTVGVVLIVAALAGTLRLLAPNLGAMPDLSGGTVGVVVGEELAARFGAVGSLLWLGLLALIGLLVAFDKYVFTVPAWVAGRMFPALRRGTGKAATATGGVAKRGLRGVLAGMVGARDKVRTVTVRLNDVDEPVEVEIDEEDETVARPVRTKKATAKKAAKKKRVVAAEEEDVEDAAYEAENAEEEDEDWEEDDAEDAYEDEDAEEEEEDDDLPGAPQVFDQDALREKIARLPVRFGADTRRSATDEDLRDLQNVGELEGYRFPPLDLLEEPEDNFEEKLREIVREQGEALEHALQQYRIDGEVVSIESGPVITLYHIRLAPGTRVSALQTVSSDIARALKAVNIRIVANQAGRDTVGIEVPNPTKERVRLKELMSNRAAFENMKLPMFLGKDASGDPLIADLTQMPHMLIAGTTGSGKSVCMNTIIMGFLYTKKPNELKMVLVDPKMVEMSQFKDIPHLMSPVVTEMGKAAAILEWAVRKMDERYELLADAGVRDIAGYNELDFDELCEALGAVTEEQKARVPRRLPYMVFIIDELADLMMTNKEVEGSIIRIAQKARAVGIHLILATQRPQANVVTGLIKSNMPCRIAFKVASGMDSRIVLDQKGGELLLGQGDMLYLSPRSSKLSRAQGTLVDDREIRKAVRFMKDVATPTFERQLVQLRSGGEDEEKILESQNNSSASLAAAQEDPMFDRAVEIVLETKRGSVSLLQRRLAIGYTRASRLIDLMGIAGIISAHKGSVARDVLITINEWDAMKALAEEEARATGVSYPRDDGTGNVTDAGAGGLFEDGEGDADVPPVAVGESEKAAVEVTSRRAAPDEDETPPFEPNLGADDEDEEEEETDDELDEEDESEEDDDEAWEEEDSAEDGEEDEDESEDEEDDEGEEGDDEDDEEGDEDDDEYEYEYVEGEEEEDDEEEDEEGEEDAEDESGEEDDAEDAEAPRARVRGAGSRGGRARGGREA
ncbi:MAG: DNA translocase FtsK [Phycisphaerales bacterium]|nr:MAG: DNA translocase FtsK [Phycisphaerales bacterium]